MTAGWSPSFRRLGAGIGSQGASLALITVLNLISVPVLLGAWGAEGYARWMVASSAALLLGLADGGLHGFFTNRIRHLWHSGRADEARRALRSGLTVYALPMAIAAAIAAWARDAVPAPFPWLAAATILILPRGMLAAVLAAGGRFELEVWLNMACMAGAQLAAMAAAGLLGLGPERAAMAYMAAYVALGWLPLLATLRGLHPELGWRPAWPRRAELALLARHAPLFLLPQGGTLALVNVPVLLLGRLADAQAVVLFTMLRTFTGLARQLVLQCAIPIGMELAGQQSRGDIAEARRVSRVADRILVTVAGLACGFALAVGPDFFRLWSHGQVAFAPLPAAVFLATVLATAPLAGALSLIRHWHDPVPQAPGVAVQVVGGIAACAVLVPAFGVMGAVAGLTVAELAAAYLLLWPAARRVMADAAATGGRWAQAAAALAVASWGGASAAAALWLVPVHGMADLVLAAGLWLLIQLPAGWAGWKAGAWRS